MQPLEKIFEQARQKQAHIVLAEGEDPRIIAAAAIAVEQELAHITLLGDSLKIKPFLNEGVVEKIQIIHPLTAERNAQYAKALFAMRKEKGLTESQATEMVRTPLAHAAMMVREGDADGTVAGAVATTADVVRHALQIIGKAKYSKIVTSFFLMLLCQSHHQKKGAFIFADCGLVVEPNADELADIAMQSAKSFTQLTAKEPAIAMLSFSSAGSATHERVSKVVQATAKVRAQAPHLCIDGELQFDTAFVEATSLVKSPDSPLKGNANIFVFPNLEAANIGYKIAQRIGGANAVGPVLQGLAKPANDLSRGCSIEDVVNMIAITAIQVN
ncbi:phosphate acetyltransferase [Paenochrobactrum sp. BZR 588]|uniref:phosphate acetyltransferase n=1 Tax=unclassified Paenochrobactrum TaxID=2639760 RepID=UPI003854B304